MKILRQGLVLSLALSAAVACGQGGRSEATRTQIEAFNQKFEDATRQMNNAAMMELWAEDGITLLPASKPVIGKAAIAAMLNAVTEQLKGARMDKFELRCSAIEVSGDLATEWCSEHQIVILPGGKPPFDGRGKMLLVLRRGADGKWRLQREMWNQGEAE
jgi:uncharacterized protein (TIGR02246 family)